MPVNREKALSVGELARRSGVAVSTIHFYEKKNLIEGWRTSGNQRRYARGTLRRIAIIRVAQKAGVSLSIIKQHLDRFPATPITVDEWAKISQDWHAMLDERITALTQLRDQLGSCIGCGCLSLKDCPLRNPDDVLGEEGAGPQLLTTPQ
ncbi:redox-sensitive transcriptional activator SoxR [Novosphingobium mangrovi (ex Hu et al. 2023)]|uniref:Redox-sensitive transcriptional activator SoxR n=1 Tax=Novosphingobium mangrovi (ex Hu et al. 2023) TaxID=2930094 RepID=A0ABT0A7X6_9SPHN|nr:redox-sensitive transcriptional activator SoxR [Novosphingobium mangrovi (ex Hu et al. 2023)]MCJ1959297.1 redox-sensitive transcriptional activator SoxR [Novosphingobium mangrovi (ex Hu et al. 2023)]